MKTSTESLLSRDLLSTEKNTPQESRSANAQNNQEIGSLGCVTLGAEARAKELEDEFLSSQLPEGFFFDEGPDGNEWLLVQKCNAKGEPLPARLICSRLDIVARTRDEKQENHGILLRWKDLDGHEHQWPMPMELLSGEGKEIREILLQKGLRIEPGRDIRDLIVKYLQASRPSSVFRCTHKLGWARDGVFVLPDRTIGRIEQEPFILQAETARDLPDKLCQGSLLDWQQNVGILCEGNPFLLFGVSMAFAGPLLKLLNVEGGGSNLRGPSCMGKTSVLVTSNSVWAPLKLIHTWRATANGLEGIAVVANDTFLCLDELGELDPAAAGPAAYMLANGQGKARSGKYGNLQNRTTWRVSFLSSGEKSIANLMAEAGKRIHAGQEVRIIDIKIFGKFGCFDSLHGHPNGSSFSDHLKEVAQLYFGTPGREFLYKLVEQKQTFFNELTQAVKELQKKLTPSNASGQVYRVAKRFALIAVAGELATKWGITGWKTQSATDAIIKIFNAWVTERGGIDSQEEREILEHIHLFFQSHAEDRFSVIPESASTHPKTINRIGFRETIDEEWHFFITPSVFNKKVCKGFDPGLVKTTCIKAGLLLPNKNKKELYIGKRLPGKKNPVYVLHFGPQVLTEATAKEPETDNISNINYSIENPCRNLLNHGDI